MTQIHIAQMKRDGKTNSTQKEKKKKRKKQQKEFIEKDFCVCSCMAHSVLSRFEMPTHYNFN